VLLTGSHVRDGEGIGGAGTGFDGGTRLFCGSVGWMGCSCVYYSGYAVFRGPSVVLMMVLEGTNAWPRKTERQNPCASSSAESLWLAWRGVARIDASDLLSFTYFIRPALRITAASPSCFRAMVVVRRAPPTAEA